MALNNGIITAPVTDSDLKTLFGVGTDIIDWCTCPDINMFARYKPVRNNIIDTNSQWDSANNTWKSTATWWRGSAENCGVTFSGYETFSTAKAAITNQVEVWAGQLPQGGASQLFRQTDFASYNHNANPCGQISALTLYKDVETYHIYLMAENDDRALDFSDIVYYNASTNPRLSTFYFTAVFVSQTDPTIRYGYSATDTLGNGGISITIPKSEYNPPISSNGWAAGTYNVYVFFTSGKYQDGESNIGSWIPLPGNKLSSAVADSRAGMLPIEVEVVASLDYLRGSATVVNTGTGYRIDWRIEEYGALMREACTLKVYANNTQEGNDITINSWSQDAGTNYTYHDSTLIESIIMQNQANYRLEFTVVHNYVTYTAQVYVLNPY